MNNLRRAILAALSLIVLFAACSGEPKTFEEEVRQLYQGDKGFFFIKIPPALMSLALNVAGDSDMSRFFGDARQVGVMSFGEGFSSTEKPVIVSQLEELLVKYEYEELIRISDSEKLLSMKMKENNGKVTELVTIVSQQDGPVMAVTLSGQIDVEQVVMMAADFDFDMLMDLQAMGGIR